MKKILVVWTYDSDMAGLVADMLRERHGLQAEATGNLREAWRTAADTQPPFTLIGIGGDIDADVTEFVAGHKAKATIIGFTVREATAQPMRDAGCKDVHVGVLRAGIWCDTLATAFKALPAT